MQETECITLLTEDQILYWKNAGTREVKAMAIELLALRKKESDVVAAGLARLERKLDAALAAGRGPQQVVPLDPIDFRGNAR